MCEQCNNPFEIVDENAVCNCNSVAGTIPQADSKCLTLADITQIFNSLKGDDWGDQVIELCLLPGREGQMVSPFTGNGTPENPLCINQDWWILFIQNHMTQGLPDVLAIDNSITGGTATDPSMIFQTTSVLTTTPQPGALEYNGNSLFITDNNGVRTDLMQTNRIYKIYPRDYNTPHPSTFNLTHSFVLTGMNLTYDPNPITAQHALLEFWPEISIFPGTTSGQLIEIFIEGTKVYELRTIATIAINQFVCGKFTISQDSKYHTTFLVRGEFATVDAAGVTVNQTISTQFTSSNANFTIQINASAAFSSRIGATFTLDKKQFDHFYNQ
jgi:hypothetical protein